MKKNAILSADADVALLLFLWKWKVSTTALLSRHFYGDRTPVKAYCRLRKLEQAGFIQAYVDPKGHRYVWSLGQKGFQAIVGRLPELREAGYKSEHKGHDLLVAAVQLGDWFLQKPEGIETFTEQQLRRYHLEHYPRWVPAEGSILLHRPDGYWRILDGEHLRTIALEVEISEKTADRYSRAARFFGFFSSIHRVLWVVETPAAGRRLESRLTKEGTENRNKHNFVSFSQYLVSGWQTKIELGPDAGITVAKLLGYDGGIEGPLIPLDFHLNVSKSPHNSKQCRSFSIGDFSY